MAAFPQIPPAPADRLKRAVELHAKAKFAPAEKIYRETLAAEPKRLDALNLLGVLMLQTGRPARGLELIEAALAIKPDFVQALNNRGNALRSLRRPQEALVAIDKALALRPDYPEAVSNRAAALIVLRRPEEALAAADRALAIQPDFLDALCNRAAALEDLRRLDESLATADRALALAPDEAKALNSRGVALRELGRFDEAGAAFDRAARADFAEARYNRGTLALLRGDFAAGWPDYEYRWVCDEAAPRRASFRRWRGEKLRGKSILVEAEQGAGDVIQFSRYLGLLAEAGAEVEFRAPPRLTALMRRLCPQVRVTSEAAPGERFDFHCELASLPLGFRTTLACLPPPAPYAADLARVARWRERIGDEGCKVGVVWQGRKGGKIDLGRSFAAAELLPLARLPGVRLISLQKNDGVEQLRDLPEGLRIETLGEDFDAGADAFLDAAAALPSLDLVVSSDTAIAHLAGALGRPAWIALKRVPDWRWLAERADSPWYPSMRLFRQRISGDWPQVFADIADALGRRLAGLDAAA